MLVQIGNGSSNCVPVGETCSVMRKDAPGTPISRRRGNSPPPKTIGRSRGAQLGAATGLDLLKLTRSLEVFKRYHGLALA